MNYSEKAMSCFGHRKLAEYPVLKVGNYYRFDKNYGIDYYGEVAQLTELKEMSFVLVPTVGRNVGLGCSGIAITSHVHAALIEIPEEDLPFYLINGV